MNIRQPYHRERTPINFEGYESVTDTSHGNDTDVNNIVARFSRTGHLPKPETAPQYADVSGLQGDLTDLINQSREAIESLQEQDRENEKIKQNKIKENAEKLKELEAQLAAQKHQVETPGKHQVETPG